MIYTIEQAAELLQVSPTTIRMLIKEKKLKAFRVGSQWRILKEDLDQFIRSQRS